MTMRNTLTVIITWRRKSNISVLTGNSNRSSLAIASEHDCMSTGRTGTRMTRKGTCMNSTVQFLATNLTITSSCLSHTSLQDVWLSIQHFFLHWCLPQGKEWLQRVLHKKTSPQRVFPSQRPHRHLMVTTSVQGGQGPGWQRRGHVWEGTPQERIYREWEESKGSTFPQTWEHWCVGWSHEISKATTQFHQQHYTFFTTIALSWGSQRAFWTRSWMTLQGTSMMLTFQQLVADFFTGVSILHTRNETSMLSAVAGALLLFRAWRTRAYSMVLQSSHQIPSWQSSLQ